MIRNKEDWEKYIIRGIGNVFLKQFIVQQPIEFIEDMILMYWDQWEKYISNSPQYKKYSVSDLAKMMMEGFKDP